MAIPASHIVQVNPRLLTPGGKDLEFNGLILTRSAAIPTDRPVLAFADPADVGAWFGLESEEHRLSKIYFQGYDNSFVKPRALYFARRVDAPAAPFLRGAAVGDAAAITALADGELTLTLSGHTATLTGLDFSGAGTLSDAARILQLAVRAESAGGAAWTEATVEYSSLFDAFTVTGGESGAGRTIAAAAGSAAEVLRLTAEDGAVVSPGSDALSEAENMEAVLRQTRNWVCFTTVWKPEADAAEALARWSDDQGVAYLYVYWDDDPKLLQSGGAATVPARFAAENLSGVAAVYDSAAYAAFILGTAASIAWERRQGAITFAFKAQDGLAPNVSTATDALNLTAQGMNFVGDYATRNDQFVFLYPGQMFGRWGWMDAYLSAVWLNNALQAAIMHGFSQTPRVPYTDAGYALVRAWIQDPVNRALRNGVIDPGVTLSESQKAELAREAGRDISGELRTDGYVIKVADPAPAVRARRESPECSLWYTYAGSVHRLELASTAVA